MQTFLVGGAVRDELLGLPVTERDWVVVGGTPEDLLEKGFKAVGKEFPVYLHPVTHEEYALARTERKIAPGYRGFRVHASPEVTLEQDLSRRDLTINAIARDPQGRLIDPFSGRKDLERRLLRHVSDAFSEDPVRILRVARFSARYAHLGFRVAEETEALMKSMVDAGEVDALVPERVWSEFSRALTEQTPVAFILVLRASGACGRLFPEIDRLFGSKLRDESYLERDAGSNALLALDNAARIDERPTIRFAALMHGLGLRVHDSADAHADSVMPDLDEFHQFCSRLKVPGSYRSLTEKVLCCEALCDKLFGLSAENILSLLQRLNGLKKEGDLKPFLTVCKIVERCRKNRSESDFPQGEFLLECQREALSVDIRSILKQGFSGVACGVELARLRILALENLIARRIQRESIHAQAEN